MRVLVTGGHGFIGRHVVDALLAHGAAVRCLHRRPARPAALDELDVEDVRADLRHPQSLGPALDGCTHVIHLGGLTRALSRRAMWQTNVHGTLALHAAAQRAGLPGRFVYCSSQAARGPAPTCAPLTEAQATAPALSWYGGSKYDAERLLAARPSGPALVVLRPPAVYGPHDTDFLTLFQGVQGGLAPILGDPTTCYSLIHAQDLAAAFVRALEVDIGAGPYFVTHPQIVSAQEMMTAAEVAVGRTARRFRLPVSTLRVVGRAADVISQLTGRASVLGAQRMRDVAAKHWVCSGGAFEREAGWCAQIPLEEGFRQTVDWYRRSGRLSGTVR